MRSLRTAALTLLFCFPAATFAQDSTCSLLAQYKQMAYDYFPSDPTNPPGVTECYVEQGGYWCEWNLESDAAGQREFMTFIREIEQCFPGSDTSSFDPGDDYYFIRTDGVEFYVTYDEDVVTMSVEMDD